MGNMPHLIQRFFPYRNWKQFTVLFIFISYRILPDPIRSDDRILSDPIHRIRQYPTVGKHRKATDRGRIPTIGSPSDPTVGCCRITHGSDRILTGTFALGSYISHYGKNYFFIFHKNSSTQKIALLDFYHNTLIQR